LQERAIAKLSPERVELATRPFLDAKKVARIYKKLGIASLQELHSHLAQGTIREVFGARMEFHVRRGLDDRPRQLLWSIEDFAEKIEEYLRTLPGVTRVSQAGSLRRKQDTIGDLNFLVAGKSAAATFKLFARFGAVQSHENLNPH
jgi:DNA polymerase (family X)